MDLNYCRLCARCDKKPLVPIFESHPSLMIREKLQKLIQIEVLLESRLPRTICLDCLTKLNQFNDFFTTSKENQIVLEIIFGSDISTDEANKTENLDRAPTAIEVEEPLKEKFYVIEEISNNEDISLDASALNEQNTTTIIIGESSRSRKKKFSRFDCYVCNEQLSGNNKFLQHFKVAHPSSEIRYTCYLCQKAVQKYRSFTRHLESHTDKRFSCDICDRNFSQKITLAQHLNTHSDIKLFKCEMCSLEFKQNSSLFKHKKQKHSNRIALPICVECQKTFVNKETLLQHMRSKHNARKEIGCNDCSKTFASRSAFVYHRSSQHQQTKAENLNCKDCKKTFKTPTILSRHIKKFH